MDASPTRPSAPTSPRGEAPPGLEATEEEQHAEVISEAPPAPASVTAIEDAPLSATPTATATPATTLPLLRDWQQQQTAVTTTTTTPEATAAPATATATGFSPPLAPSVILGERASSRSYPVARSIVTIVRGAVDAVADHIHDHMQMQSPNQQHQNNNVRGHIVSPIQCLSIRSEGGIPVSTTTTTNNNVATGLPYIPADSVRSVPAMERGDDFMNSEEQFVLIDGDLVALPPSAPNESEREGLEEYQRDQENFHQKSCQPKPMRKGVRGLRKWIKRKAFRNNKKEGKQKAKANLQSQIQEDSGNFNTPPVSQCDTLDNHGNHNLKEPPAESSKTRSPRNKSPMRGPWKYKKKEDPKKKRKSWKKTQRSMNEPIIPENSILETCSTDAADQFISSSPPSPQAAASCPAAAATATFPSSVAAMPQLHPHQSVAQQQHHQQQHQQQAAQDQNQAAAYASLEEFDALAPPAAAYPYDPLSAPAAPAAAAYYEDSLNNQEPPPMSGPPTHQESVHASFVGNVDQVGVLDAAPCAEAYIEGGAWSDEKKDEPSFSLVPRDADYKVDKADAPDVEYMLRRAEQETINDVLEKDSDEDLWADSRSRLSSNKKTTGMSCPFSSARATDALVHNDVLKVVMVGAPGCDKGALARAIRGSNKKPRRKTTLGVDVHSWAPDMEGEPVKFSIWDVQGASQQHSDANFGANPGIQSLFFSANALYLLVWDLAADNMKTYGRACLLNQLQEEDDDDEGDDDDDDDDEEDNQFLFEEAKRQADLALQGDIEERVLSWIDCIARRGPGSSILPVAMIPEHMAGDESKRRCDMMQGLLEHHIHRYENVKLLTGMDCLLCVSLAQHAGIQELQETLIAIAADESVFDHVGTPVHDSTVKVMETIRRLRQDHKLIRVEHLMSEMGKHIMGYDQITDALHFLSSIGELMYFGNQNDELLSRYVILSRKWFVSALSCILRNDLKREIAETRRFLMLQCIYSDHQQFSESPVIQALTGGSSSSCPLLSSTDANMLWLSMQFMREAADRSSQLSESSTTSSTMFGFLERLLVQSGVFLPLNVSQSMDEAEVYFVPSLMATSTADDDVWTFKSSEGWMTTLCHSWLFRDGAPSDLMEHLTVGLIRDLYEFSRTFPTIDLAAPPHRSQSFPLVRSGTSDFLKAHDQDTIGRIKIHQIMCWQSSFLVKIGCIFADESSGDLKESFVEVFVILCDQSSSHCVASDAMRATMQRLVVSGKGQSGSHGAKLWNGGFDVVLKSIETTLGDFSNIDRQVVCPECLSHSQPRYASTWSWDSVKCAANSGSSIVRCIRGHRVDSNLICGLIKKQEMPMVHEQSLRSVKPVPELLDSIVLVGLWDADAKEIRNVGSGFIADKRLGLIVTAGHVLFNMEEGKSFGTPYYGYKNAEVVIGVIPDRGHNAVYRYFAEIIADDISGVDACVVRLTSKINIDIDGDLAQQPDEALSRTPLNLESICQESLRSLKLTSRYELEESVRILGFNQGGEGVLELGKHVNRSADFAKGYIVKKFVAPLLSDDDSSHSSTLTTKSMCFVPREEIVVICPTIAGHSGGPCVNNDGKVIGILSRADPGERQRCYLVPSSELKDLIKKAKKHFTRPSVGLTL